MAAGYAAMEGGRTLKQKVERRKHATLDGDFIIASADPAKNRKRTIRTSLKEAKQGLNDTTTQMKHSLNRLTSSFSIEEAQEDQAHREPEYEMGQEVWLQNMDETILNGTKALVLQDFGSKGVLVQFLTQKDGHDNYHESGILLQPRNISTEAPSLAIGTAIELQDLKALHMNGLRGVVVEPAEGLIIKEGRVAVQLESSKTGVISVKIANCRVVTANNNEGGIDDGDKLFQEAIAASKSSDETVATTTKNENEANSLDGDIFGLFTEVEV